MIIYDQKLIYNKNVVKKHPQNTLTTMEKVLTLNERDEVNRLFQNSMWT